MTYKVLREDYINSLFKGTKFGPDVDNSVEGKVRLIVKTLKNQLAGYWSGSTAYNICVNGGFLLDAKTTENKELTQLGRDFLQEHDSNHQVEKLYD